MDINGNRPAQPLYFPLGRPPYLYRNPGATRPSSLGWLTRSTSHPLELLCLLVSFYLPRFSVSPLPSPLVALSVCSCSSFLAAFFLLRFLSIIYFCYASSVTFTFVIHLPVHFYNLFLLSTFLYLFNISLLSLTRAVFPPSHSSSSTPLPLSLSLLPRRAPCLPPTLPLFPRRCICTAALPSPPFFFGRDGEN